MAQPSVIQEAAASDDDLVKCFCSSKIWVYPAEIVLALEALAVLSLSAPEAELHETSRRIPSIYPHTLW